MALLVVANTHGRFVRYGVHAMTEMVIVAALAAGILAIRHLASGARNPQELEAWERAAHTLGGRVEQTSKDGFVLRFEVDGVHVEIATRLESMGNQTWVVTVLSAVALPGARDAAIQVERRGVLGSVVRPLFAGREATSGDRTFDDMFRITANPTSLASAFLDRSVRASVTAGAVGFELREYGLTMSVEGKPTESGPLVALGRHAQTLVRAWVDLVRGPERVAHALGWSLDGPVAIPADGSVVVARGVRRALEGELRLDAKEGVLFTVVRFVALSAPAEVPAELESIAEYVGVRDVEGGVEIGFEGLRLDPAAMCRGLDALLSATETSRPYR